MPTYKNGYVPADLLVVFKRGWNRTDGDWIHAFPPATYARHLALIARARERTGRTLALNYGWTAYRPYAAQVILKAIFGIGAATPGTSSHGGFWEGRQTMAGDYSNWAEVYAGFGGRAAFADDCRAVGLLPNMIVPARGYPDEPWHVIDPNPWSAVPSFAGVVLPFDPKQEDVMNSDQESKFDKKFDVLTDRILDLHRQLTGSDGHEPGAIDKIDNLEQHAGGVDRKLDVIQARVIDLHQQLTGSDDHAPGALSTILGSLAGINPEFNEAEFAASLAPLIVGNLRSLDDDTITAIAAAVNDEAHRRSAE